MEDVLSEVLQGKHQDVIGALAAGLTLTGEVKTPRVNDKHYLSMFVYKQRWVKGPKHATSILTKVNAKNRRGFFVLLDEGKDYMLCLSTGHSVEYFGIAKTNKGFLIRDMSRKRQVLARADDTNSLIHLLAGPDKDPQTPPVRLTAGLHRGAVSEDKARWFAVAKPPETGFVPPSPMKDMPTPLMSPVSQFANSPNSHVQQILNPAAQYAPPPAMLNVPNDEDDEEIISPALRHNPRRQPHVQDRLQIHHDARNVDISEPHFAVSGSRQPAHDSDEDDV